MVDLWAADAFFVTETPKALKQAIEKQIKTLSMINILFALKSSKAYEVFSTDLYGQSSLLSHLIAPKIGSRAAQIQIPQRPS